MIIKVDKNPYDEPKNLYKYTEVDFPTGVTVLVGKNGSGKTTLLDYIKNYCEENNISVISYDNYLQGGGNSLEAALFHDDMQTLATLACSSEGQKISVNIGNTIGFIGRSVRNAESDSKLVILLDAVDSGLSIDTIVEIKDIFNLIINDASEKNVEVFIIVSANGYEFPNGSRCLNVTNGKFVTFANYEEYKKFILTDKTK